jgi:hypothetical protein
MPDWPQEQQQAFIDLPVKFPKLVQIGISVDDVTSPKTPIYNCVAYAAQDETQPWWPMPQHLAPRYYYWPPGLPRQIIPTVENFFNAFETLGYERCSTGAREEGFEKVTIYVRNGVPKHMARELGDGIWYSKLGDEQDIRQHVFDAVENPVYGDARYFMRKPLPAPVANENEQA